MHNETIYQCPVCLGIPLEKLQFAKNKKQDPIILDFCKRCGGMWFDYGEVQQLQELKSHFKKEVPILSQTYLMPCHQCHNRMDRNLEKCPSCDWKNIIDCPVCLKPMNRKESLDICLDYCKDCKGVWFDNLELAMIWNGYLEKVAHHEQQNRSNSNYDGESLFIDMLIWSPDLVYYGGRAAVEATSFVVSHAPEAFDAVVGAASHAPEMAGALFDGFGDIAGSIFSFIGEIIGGLFDG